MSDGIKLLERPLSPKEVIEGSYLDAIVKEGIFPAGAFKLALPKLWATEVIGAESFPTPERPVVTLARFTPGLPDALGAAISAKVAVHCAWLPREMNGSDWLRRWCMSQDLQIHDMRELPTSYGVMGDAVALNQTTGRLHRMLTVKDGDLLFVTDGSVDPRGRPEDPMLQEIALMAAIRFELLNSSGQIFAEPMQTQELVGRGAQAGFLAPDSWVPTEGIEVPPNGAALRLVTRMGDTTVGSMIATLGSPDITAEEMEEVLIGKLAYQGQSWSAAEPILKAQRGSLVLEVFRRAGRVGDTEMVILSLRALGEEQPLSLSVISPSGATQFEAWAVNRRAFEIALETVVVQVIQI